MTAHLIDLFRRNRELNRAIVYLTGEHEQSRVSFGELEQRGLAILHRLQNQGAQPGDKLILFVNDNEHFIQGFWGGVFGGIVPVPVAPGISDEHRHKLLRIVRKLGNPFIYTDSKTLARIREFATQAGEAALFAHLEKRALLTDAPLDLSQAGRTHTPNGDDPLFIQFSSGSTSEPKGVVLTHRNVITNCMGTTQAANFNENDVGLSWMPLTHDMGLVGMHFMMMYGGVHQHFMPTDLFIRRPRLWMEFASRVKATITTSPNFGLSHFLKALGDRAVTDWDLSNLRLIFNGAEPISRSLCDEFMDRLAPAKLKRTAMFPVYGLAEASLAVAFPKLGSNYHSLVLDRHHLNVGEAAASAANPRDAAEFVAVGTAVPHCEVRLTDDNDAVVADGHVGHLHIRGGNVTRGYFDDAEVNARSFTTDGWLRTGDLGLFKNGELYITGRAKDIIFVNGQNYYPHDLEAIATQAPGLELNKVVVAGVRPDNAPTDELSVFVLHRGSAADFVPITQAVSRLINEQTGLEVTRVVPVKRIPKTTSGKLQRHLLAQAYLDGEFDADMKELAPLLAPSTPGSESSETPGHAIIDRIKAICDTELTDRSIGINDNLFDIGVSSLKLVAIHEKIDQEFPGMVDLTELFEHPTIAELAARLEAKIGGR